MARKSKRTGKAKGRPRAGLPVKDNGQLTATARLAKRIREAREAKGIGCASAAAVAKLSLSRWYDIEAGRFQRSPPIGTLHDIATAVGVNDSELIELALKIQ